MGNTLQNAIPLERNPIGTKAQQNENMCPIRSKEAFVLTGFRSDGPTQTGTGNDGYRSINVVRSEAPKSWGLTSRVRFPDIFSPA